MKKAIKRGFTLVELLVVIAILAILATVSIVGYTKFIEKANKSVDEQFVTQMNTILAAAEASNEKLETITDARSVLFANEVNSIVPTYAGHKFWWISSENVIVITEKNATIVLYPEAYEGKDLTTAYADNYFLLPSVLFDSNDTNVNVEINLIDGVKYQASGCDGVIYARNNANITINGNGSIIAEKVDGFAMAIWARDNSKVFVNGGSYTQNLEEGHKKSSLIYAHTGAIIEINGGTFKATDPQWTLNLSDNSGSQIIVKGGEFFEFDPSKAYTEPGWMDGTTYSFVADGYKVVWQERDGHQWFKVIEESSNLDGWNSIDTLPSDWCDWE